MPVGAGDVGTFRACDALDEEVKNFGVKGTDLLAHEVVVIFGRRAAASTLEVEEGIPGDLFCEPDATLTEDATGLGTAGTSKSAVTVDYQGEKGQALVISGAVGTSGLTAPPTNVQLTGTAVSLLDISTVNGANEALKSIDAALTSVNTSRADLGAIQNRFASTVTNLQTMSENISASRSRILDADFAAETAALTRNQILQQAGVAMLSQANALPQNVLSLLK